jgi:hypothetical protein
MKGSELEQKINDWRYFPDDGKAGSHRETLAKQVSDRLPTKSCPQKEGRRGQTRGVIGLLAILDAPGSEASHEARASLKA